MPENETGVAIGTIAAPAPDEAKLLVVPSPGPAPDDAGRDASSAMAINVLKLMFLPVPLCCLSLPRSKFSIMYLIGVIPAMGSFENGKVKATAPTNLPSMYTGLPLIPA